jgi:hypothetical protein
MKLFFFLFFSPPVGVCCKCLETYDLVFAKGGSNWRKGSASCWNRWQTTFYGWHGDRYEVNDRQLCISVCLPAHSDQSSCPDVCQSHSIWASVAVHSTSCTAMYQSLCTWASVAVHSTSCLIPSFVSYQSIPKSLVHEFVFRITKPIFTPFLPRHLEMLEVALNLWKGVLLEKMTVAQLVNTYPPSVNREVN